MGMMVSPIVRIKITPIIRLQEEDIRSWQINDAKLYGSSFLPIIYRTHCHLSFVSELWPLQAPVHRYSMCFWSWEEKRSLLKMTNQSTDKFFTNEISSLNEMILCFFFVYTTKSCKMHIQVLYHCLSSTSKTVVWYCVPIAEVFTHLVTLVSGWSLQETIQEDDKLALQSTMLSS
jgi:hypothetical protein